MQLPIGHTFRLQPVLRETGRQTLQAQAGRDPQASRTGNPQAGAPRNLARSPRQTLQGCRFQWYYLNKRGAEPLYTPPAPSEMAINNSASLWVVETQQANWVFSCPRAAAKKAESERQWWREHTGTSPIIAPVPLADSHKFRPADCCCPLEPGESRPSRRVQRHCHRWHKERAAWWNSPAD